MNLHVLNAPCNEKITNAGTSHMMNLCCLYFRDNPRRNRTNDKYI